MFVPAGIRWRVLMSNIFEQSLLLRVTDVVVVHQIAGKHTIHAVSGVSLDLKKGETLGLVGESGCGKSSLARAVMQLPRPTGGSICLDGEELTTLDPVRLQTMRSRFQMIFQDPVAALNPLRPVGESVAAPLRYITGINRSERNLRAEEMLATVGLDPEQYFHRLPRQLSGGQCQRVCIARALITNPDLLVCDEPVTALDVSIQAQILNLLREIREHQGLSMLFIAHDLAVVKNICDRVAVMYLGRLCEVASCEVLFEVPAHPYTAALMAAAPRPAPDSTLPGTVLLSGELPSATAPPNGCRFHTRCPRTQEICRIVQPELNEIRPGHRVACHYPLQPGISL